MVNVMDDYIKYTDKCLMKYLKFTYEKKFNKQIAQRFVDTYLNVRYSNYIDEESVKLPLSKKITKALDFVKNDLILEYGESLKDTINLYRKFSNYFYNLDQLYLLEAQKKVINDINDDRNKELNEVDNSFVASFSAMLREDIKKKKDYLDSFESQTFKLEFEKFNKTDYGVKLTNNIVFPELFSDVAIKKAAQKDSIAEDMTAIGFLQTTCTIINNLISCDFDKNYFIHLPSTFFDKKSKVARLFSIVDDLYIQDKIRIVITFACFVRYKSYVMEFMRQGFVFAIYLDEQFDYSSENIKYLELFDKIFIENDKYYYKDMKNNGKIRDRIITIGEVK